VKIKIVYDNNAEKGFKSGWGFSCLIENKEKVLFDTGSESQTLLFNMEQLKISPKDIDAVILSHAHGDHTGGLRGFLEANGNKAKIYKPSAFSKLTQIYKGIYSTGPLGGFWAMGEQSLVVNSEKGNIVITGCAHPGLENIIEKARQLGKIYGVIGGFHGFSKLEKLEGIELIAPCHCTQHIQEIKEKYPTNYREIKAGSVIEI
jgi:7,8-dihydropterin-6-yl-methyl-4-(beta-D-ribofuranosyl)aminobenzene 5'-phosphate synthase